MNRAAPWLLLVLLLPACGDSVEAAQQKLVHGRSPHLRAAAAHRLGQLGGSVALGALTLHGIRDVAPEVRIASVDALADKEHPRIVDLFGDLLLDPEATVQEAAARGLARRGGTKARRYLELAYPGADLRGRIAIAGHLVSAGGSAERAVQEAARQTLEFNLAAIRSNSTAERIGAAEELGRSGTPEAVAALLPLLADRSVTLAAAAARGLGRAGDTKAVEPLRRVLGEPYPTLRGAAAWALGRLGDPSAVPALGTAATDSGTRVALEAVESIERLGSGGADQAGAVLCRIAAEAGTADVAVAAAEASVRIGARCAIADAVSARLRRGGLGALPALGVIPVLGPEALDANGRAALVELCRGEDLLVAAHALRAASLAGVVELKRDAVEALAQLVAEDRSGRREWVSRSLPTTMGWGIEVQEAPEPQDPGLDGFGLLDSEAPHEQFEKMMGMLASQRAKQDAQRAVARGLPVVDVDSATAKHLEELMHDAVVARVELVDDTPAHAVARLVALAQAAARADGEAARSDLEQLVEHPDSRVRIAAVGALGEVDGTEKLLTRLLGPDRPPDVVESAATALGHKGVGSAAIVAALTYTSSASHPALANALGELGGESAETALEGLLDSSAAPAAARALGRIGSPKALGTLAEHVESAVPRGRFEAVQALAAAGPSPSSREGLWRSLHDERPEIRAAAAAAFRARGENDPWLSARKADYDLRVRRAASGASNP